MVSARVLPGLPPYGPHATAIPAEWGRLAREGLVVEFRGEFAPWVGNVQPGLGGIDLVHLHPNKKDVIVIATGTLWVVDPESRNVERLLPAVFAAFEVDDPPGWVFSRQGLALARLGPEGLRWHTRRLSYDGFDQLRIEERDAKGLAWAPDDQWYPFQVDLRTGKSTGGSFPEKDIEGWEILSMNQPGRQGDPEG